MRKILILNVFLQFQVLDKTLSRAFYTINHILAKLAFLLEAFIQSEHFTYQQEISCLIQHIKLKTVKILIELQKAKLHIRIKFHFPQNDYQIHIQPKIHDTKFSIDMLRIYARASLRLNSPKTQKQINLKNLFN